METQNFTASFTAALNAENALLGTCLEHSEAWETALEKLTHADFLSEHVQAAFDYAAAYYRRNNRPPVKGEMLENSGVDKKFLVECWTVAGFMHELDQNIACIRQSARRRELGELGRRLAEGAELGADDQQMQAEVEDKLRELNERSAGDVRDGEQAQLSFLTAIDANDVIVKTQNRQLDAMLGGGLMPSALYILAGRPGCGKTAFALQIADLVAINNKRVLFVSLEMDIEQLQARRIARLTGIPASRMLIERDLTDEEMANVAKTGNALAYTPFYFNGKDRCTVADIRSMARRVPKLNLVVIDYLGLIKPVGGKNKSRYEEVTEISNDLKALARQLKVPILCLAQLNRASELRNTKKPTLADLRDSGAIEQDADAVILLHRYGLYDEDEKSSELQRVTIDIAKNRHAGTGEFDMAMVMKSGGFRPYDRYHG